MASSPNCTSPGLAVPGSSASLLQLLWSFYSFLCGKLLLCVSCYRRVQRLCRVVWLERLERRLSGLRERRELISAGLDSETDSPGSESGTCVCLSSVTVRPRESQADNSTFHLSQRWSVRRRKARAGVGLLSRTILGCVLRLNYRVLCIVVSCCSCHSTPSESTYYTRLHRRVLFSGCT